MFVIFSLFFFVAVLPQLVFLQHLSATSQDIEEIIWYWNPYRNHYLSNISLFTNSSYKPIQRIFVSKIIASMLVMSIISLPLIIKLCISFQFLKAICIVIGFIFLISSSILLGQVTKGKKLFEVTFFLVTYANINGIPFFDYFGAFSNNLTQINMLSFIILLFLVVSLYIKNKPEYR